jgi:hypothetical protein
MYAYVLEMVSSLQFSQLKFCMHFSFVILRYLTSILRDFCKPRWSLYLYIDKSIAVEHLKVYFFLHLSLYTRCVNKVMILIL